MLTRRQRIEQLLWAGMSYIDIMEFYASMLVRFSMFEDMKVDICEQMKLCKTMYISDR